MTIYIKKEISELSYQMWGFHLLYTVLYLDSYSVWSKESKRKIKYNKEKCYLRLSSRDSTLNLSDVPFDDEIKKEALCKLIDMITIKTWEEINK